MDDEAYEHAQISQSAYDYHYLGADKAQELLENNYPGYIIDPENSNSAGITVIRPDGEAIIGYRGTDVFNAFDITADLLIATGYPTVAYSNIIPGTRFDTSQQLFDQVSEQYPISSVTGHSLGGSITDYIARRNNVKGISFNPGETPLEYFGARIPSETKVYTTGNDIISKSAFASGNYKNIITIPSSSNTFVGIHSLDNFLKKNVQKEQFINQPDFVLQNEFKKQPIQPASYHLPVVAKKHHFPMSDLQPVKMRRPCRLVSFAPVKLGSRYFPQQVVCGPTKGDM